MNAPTIIGALVVVVILAAIIVRGILNRRRGKSGCSCGCEGCSSSGACHPKR